MVEGARLESVYGSNVIAGSNPVLSAKINNVQWDVIYFYCELVSGARVAAYHSKWSEKFMTISACLILF